MNFGFGIVMVEETLRIKNSGPHHLFIDEEYLFCPQGRVSEPNSAQMLHAANNLCGVYGYRGDIFLSWRNSKAMSSFPWQLNRWRDG
jgi:hypothetical protein